MSSDAGPDVSAPASPYWRPRDLGEQVRQRRDEVGINQTDLGVIAGVHRATIRAVETGKSVEMRTFQRVVRALGCAGPTIKPGELSPVLTARATEIILRGLLRSAEDELPTRIADYMELVTALKHRALSASYARLRGDLGDLVPLAELELVDREIRAIVPSGVGNPVDPRNRAAETPGLSTVEVDALLGPETKIGPWVPPGGNEVRIVLDSNLSAEVKQALMDHLARRREEMESTLRREATMLVRIVGVASPPRASTDHEKIASWIDHVSRLFRVRRFGSGYDPEQVDTGLGEVLSLVRQGHAVPDGLLSSRRFEVVQGGYFEAEVDAALGDLRQRLAEAGLLTSDDQSAPSGSNAADR